MAALTLEDLRQELQHFAENAIHGRLSDFSASIRESICDDVQRVINTSLHAYHLPMSNQPPNLQPQVLRQAANVDVSPESHPLQIGTDQTNNTAEAFVKFADEQTNNREVMLGSNWTESNEVLDDAYAAAKEKGAKLRTAVATEASLAQQLKILGYFHRCDAFVQLDESEESAMRNVKTAKDAMLHTSATASPLTPKTQTWLVDPEELDHFVSRHRDCITRLVCSDFFDYCVLFCVFANAAFIGIVVESTTANPSASKSALVSVFEVFFFAIFAMELGLRIFVYGLWFFKCRTPSGSYNPDIVWNIADTLIVMFHLLELILAHIEGERQLHRFSLTRVCRIMRIVRLIRVAKLVHLFRSLRIMASAMLSSFGPFVWGLVSLQTIAYVFAVYLTEIVAAHLKNHGHNDGLKEHFGSLTDSWMSLLKAVTGGIDWGDLTDLLEKVGVWRALVPFLVYLFFILLALMNVFTGMFIDSAQQKAKNETELQLLQHAHVIFKASDNDDDDMISKEEFHATLSHSAVQDFFDAISFDIQQAEILFELLDTTSDGTVSFQEFLRGCLRLRGTAKALDLLILSREVHQLIDGLAEIAKGISISVQYLIKEVMVMNQDNQRLLSELATQHRSSIE